MEFNVGENWHAVSNHMGGEVQKHLVKLIHGVNMAPFGYDARFWVVEVIDSNDGRSMPGAAVFWIDELGESVGQVAQRTWQLVKRV